MDSQVWFTVMVKIVDDFEFLENRIEGVLMVIRDCVMEFDGKWELVVVCDDCCYCDRKLLLEKLLRV